MESVSGQVGHDLCRDLLRLQALRLLIGSLGEHGGEVSGVPDLPPTQIGLEDIQSAGVRFMATGGIGGVHRGRPDDQSADLFELARSPVAVVCAGPKVILDVPATLERLESLCVPVLGYGCDECPAFYTARSGQPVSAPPMEGVAAPATR